MKKLWCCISIAMIATSCVNPIQPTGGPVDKQPPQMIDSLNKPLYETTNFKGKQVKLYFDEAIQARGLLNEMLITPTVEGSVEHEINKEKKGLYSLTLTFEKLDTNTTYIISLGEGIQDINEGNVAKNPGIAFSTGPFMDSLEIKGKVKDHYTGKPSKDYFVGLYADNDTLDPLQHKPQYYKRTKEDGSYHFDHIKRGMYYLQVFNDKNKNKQFDYKNEKGSFIQEKFMLKKDTSFDFNVFLSLDTITKINAIKRDFEKGVTSIIFNKSIATLDNAPDHVYLRQGEVHVYHQDSLPTLSLQGYDSLYQSFKTDTSLKSIEVEEKGSIKIQNTDNQYFKEISGELFVNQPFFKLDKEHILYATNTDTIPVDSSNLQLQSSIDTIYMKQTEGLEDTVSIIFDSLAVTDEFGRTNKRSVFTFNKENREEYGTISGEVNTTEESYVLQCLNKNGEVVKQKINPTAFKFTYLKPDTYTLRLLIDENRNGFHEKGSVLINRYPEPVYVNKKEFALKANWEINNEQLEYKIAEKDTTSEAKE